MVKYESTVAVGGRVGDPTSTSSMQTKIKDLLLRAWRHRWSAEIFSTQLKQVIPRGISGDVFYLSDCILKQAVAGPVPIELFLSYLNHCIGSYNVSIGEAILAITRISDPKPQAIASLLELINRNRNNLTCKGSADECLVLSRALVAYLCWLYQLISQSIKEILESKSQTNFAMTSFFATTQDPKAVNPNEELYLGVIKHIAQSIDYIASTPLLKSLMYVGKFEDPSTWSTCMSTISEVIPRMMLLTDKFETNSRRDLNERKTDESPLKVLANFRHSVEWIEHSNNPSKFLSATPSISVAFEQLMADQSNIPYRPLVVRSIRSAITFAAMLDLSIRNELLANQLALIGRFFDLSRVQIYYEALHVTLVGLLEDAKTNLGTNFNWAAFLLFKLPKTFECLSQHFVKLRPHCSGIPGESEGGRKDLEVALDMIFAHTPLLDLFNQAYSILHLQRLIKDFKEADLISADHCTRFNQAIVRHVQANQLEAPRTSLSIVLRIDPTFTSVIQSLGETSDPLEPTERRVSILAKVQKQLDLYLSLVASKQVMVHQFAQQLQDFLEQSRHVSLGESQRASQFRAIMFDISFLYLVNIVQRLGLEVVAALSEKDNSKSTSFFVRWCRWNIPPTQNRKSPKAILKSYEEKTITEAGKLKAQFFDIGGEWKTIGVNWEESMVAAQLAIKDIAIAWQADMINESQLAKLVERFGGTLCSMSVVAITWLMAQLQVVADENEKTKLLVLLEHLRMSTTDSAEPSSAGSETSFDNVKQVLALHYRERSQLMTTAVSKLFKRFLPLVEQDRTLQSAALSPPSMATVKTNLDKKLENLLTSAKANHGWTEVNELHELVQLGGVQWFTIRVVRHFFFQLEPPPLEAVDVAYGLFQLDLEQCSMTLLREALPEFLLYVKHVKELTEPRVSALVKLAVMTTFGAIVQLQTFRQAKLNRRCGHRESYELEMYSEEDLIEMKPEMIADTAFSYSMPKRTRKADVGLIAMLAGDDGEPMQVDGEEIMVEKQNNRDDWWLTDDEIHHEPIYIEFVKFVKLLADLVEWNEYHPRLLVPQALLEQILLCLREDAGHFYQFVPTQLVEGLMRLSPEIFTSERLLTIFPLDSMRTRKLSAKWLCQLDANERALPSKL